MTYDELSQMIPESVKLAMRNGQFHKVAAEMNGWKSTELPEILESFGTKLASRQERYRVITDGLNALETLKKD
jgi:hypothetical protein